MGIAPNKNSSEQLIRSKLCAGCVYYYRTKNVGYDSDAIHYYVVVNRTPLTDTVIYLCWISKKVKEIKALRRLKFFKGTLIDISPSEYNVLSVPSIIDCNRIEERSLEEIIKNYRRGMIGFKKNLPMIFLKKIWDAIQLSPTLNDKIKNQIDLI